jgi:hypothetical protein
MRRVLILVIVLLAVLLPATSAHAGTFLVRTCGTSAVNNAWQATPPPPGIMEVNESCQSPWPMQGPWVRDVLASSSDLTDGQGAWLIFDAEPATRIAGITYKRWLWKVAIEDLQPALSTGEGVVLETCSIQFGTDRCNVGGEGTSAVSFGGLDTDQLRVGVGCEITPGSFGTTCPGGGTQHGYGAVIYDAAVTIEDDAAPAAPTVAAEDLWSGAAWHRGASSIKVSGTDASGVAGVRIYRDGQLLVEEPATCDFTHPKPCPDAAALEVPIDTTLISDGEHDVAVALVDPAGNESPHATREVLIANNPPAAPTLTLTPTHATSPNFTVSWSATPGHPVAIALAHVLTCHAGVCSQATTSASSIDLTAPGVGETTISVYLEDVAGNTSFANAATGSFFLDLATAPTDPPAGPSPPGTDPPPSGDPLAKTSPLLGLALTATASRLIVRVRVDARVTDSVRIAIRWRVGRNPARRRWTAVYPRRVSVREGRGVVSLKRPAKARLARVLISYDGDSTFQRAVAQRTIRLR